MTFALAKKMRAANEQPEKIAGGTATPLAAAPHRTHDRGALITPVHPQMSQGEPE